MSISEQFGLTVTSKFVPFSQSRNKDEKHRTLNWVVTLHYNGREVLSTEYSAGEASCPSYKQGRRTIYDQELIDFETERGLPAKRLPSFGVVTCTSKKHIFPNPDDVVYSLIMDADALDYPTFDNWADSFGYSTDSRSAEKIYRQCLEIGLRLRSSLGDEKLAELREAFSDY